MYMTKRIQNLRLTSLCLLFLAFEGSGCSKAGSTTTVSAVTYLSVIQGAPISGAANVYLNDTLITNTAFSPGTFSPKYGTIRPGSYSVKFKKAGTDSLFDQLLASPYDTLNFYTLLLYNNSTDKAAHALKIFDDFSAISNNNKAYYRFFNLAPDLPSVNFYISGTLAQSNRTPADNAVNNQLNTFTAFASGPTVLTVKNASTDSVLVSSPGLTLNSGTPYTIWITGTKAQNNLSINVLQAQY
jgi:hypothetical protein